MAVSIITSPITSRPAPSRCRAIQALLAAATLVGSASTSSAQVELKTYADAKGYIVVRNLTCAQLAGTFQEDADFLGVWVSGWYNGRNKKHMINVDRTKAGIHEVIVYCQANPDKKVVNAVDIVLKGK
jgi:HdeA/HdeB family